ncbi:hypothetical protein [Diplocloster hominis]|uniref:hypothetical protein n=1 Tax=Diplocloster hominis TaxID=3079010 RepID=UPI0031BA76AD
MKQIMKQALKDAFEAPEPVGKQAFFKTIRPVKISQFSFLWIQATFIRKTVWALSVILFGIALAGAIFINQDTLWIISSLIPFAALSAVTENARSRVYNMEELEMASRFSLKSVTLARMGIMGLLHLILLGLLIPLSCIQGVTTAIQTGVYLLVPYLLTTVSGLCIVRKIHGKEALYGCMAAAVITSGLNLILQTAVPVLYQNTRLHWWIAALLILAALTALETYKIVHQTEEELICSLS